MENPLRYQPFKSDNPTISASYTKTAQKLVESMILEDDDIIMNYSCGGGDILFIHSMIKVKARCVCGVDDDPMMIRFAHENCKNKENMYFAIGDIMDKYQWTFKQNMVNKFIAYLVLCYVQDYRGFINKVYDFLRPSGQVGMLVPFSKAYGIPYQLLAEEKWKQFVKNEKNKSSFAEWTYSNDIDVPSVIHESLISSQFKIDRFTVEQINLEFPSIRNLCEFLCTLTSSLSTIPEQFHDEFMQEMESLVTNNLGSRGIIKKLSDGGTSSVISVDWNFLNFVASK